MIGAGICAGVEVGGNTDIVDAGAGACIGAMTGARTGAGAETAVAGVGTVERDFSFRSGPEEAAIPGATGAVVTAMPGFRPADFSGSANGF